MRRSTRGINLLVVSLAAGAVTLGGLVTPVAATAAPPGITHPVVVNPDPVDNTPQVMDGQTQAVADLGSRVLIGGRFTTVKDWNEPTRYPRSNLFAYTKATGEVDQSFDPHPDGQVTAMLVAADGDVYVSGQFKNFGDDATPYLVKIDPITGAQDPTFSAKPDGMVYDLQLANGMLYLGGSFAHVDGAVRTNFAIVNVSTGALLGSNVAFTDPIEGIARIVRFDITPDGTRLVAVGNFTTVAGQQRENVAKLNLLGEAAIVDGWHTDVYRFGECAAKEYLDTYLKDVDISPDGSYFVVVTIGGWHGVTAYCDTSARWEVATTGEATSTWRDDTGGDSLTAVAITGPAIYIGGHLRWLNNPRLDGKGPRGPGSVARQGIAALDPASGLPLSWNPGRERGLRVWRMTATPDGLYILSDSSGFADEWHPRLTYLLTAGGTPPVKAITATTPTYLAYVVGNSVRERSFDGSTVGPEQTIAGANTWRNVRGIVMATDRTYRFSTSGDIERSINGHHFKPRKTWTEAFTKLSALTFATQPDAGGQVIFAHDGDSALHARGFGVENGLVAAISADISGPGIDGMNWSDVRGLAVIDGSLFHTHADGTLRRTAMDGQRLVPATTVTISGPSIDGVDWSKTHALHALPSVAG